MVRFFARRLSSDNDTSLSEALFGCGLPKAPRTGLAGGMGAYASRAAVSFWELERSPCFCDCCSPICLLSPSLFFCLRYVIFTAGSTINSCVHLVFVQDGRILSERRNESK